MQRLTTWLLLFFTSLGINAKEAPLGQVLRAFSDAGYAIVYSTALVEVDRNVAWNGELSLRALREVLANQNLQLSRLNGRRWGIVPRSADISTTNLEFSVPTDTPPIDHIIVTASRYKLQRDELRGSHAIGPAALNDTPSFAGDSLRIVHRLPGAATLGVTAKPNVRGGSDDELLVLFDGVELIEPFHLRDFQSLFSSFNPQTIQSVEFFSGGFPARYGNKMSGVMDIATHDAFEAPGGELGISAFSLSALYFNEREHDQWLLSARRGNLDLILPANRGEPKYHDLYGRYSRDFTSGRLKASAFVFDDNIRFNHDESRASSKVKNRYAWFEWQTEGQKIDTSSIVSFGTVDKLRQGETFSEDDTEGTLYDDHKLKIISLKHLMTYKPTNDLRLDFGGTYRDLNMDYDTRISVARDTVAEFLGLPTELNSHFDRSFSGDSISLFATARYQVRDDLTAELGLRWDRQNYALSDSQFSPRFALLYNIRQNWDLRLSYGRFNQPQAIHELRTADQETSFFKAQKSDHYTLATTYRFQNGNRFSAEIFLKQMDNLKPRYINLFDPYIYVPELQQDRIRINADEATARGIELTYTGSGNNFDWSMNYTYSKVRDRDSGRWVDRRWDQTHTVNGSINWYRGNWSVGIAAAWHTGWATTKLPAALSIDANLNIPEYRNNDRLKDYGTLDFKVSYDQELSNSSIQYFLEVTNAVSRANKGGVDYEISGEENLYLLEEFDVEPVFPLVTNLGVVWRF